MDESGDDTAPEGALSVPDFAGEALAHLQVQSGDFAVHVQTFVQGPNPTARQLLCDDLRRFRNTLVLLDKSAVVYVAEELLALLAADEQGHLGEQGELARVLLLASEELSHHVALLLDDITIDNALPLLPLVNDSRACRNEALLSDALVLAAGIELPEFFPVAVDGSTGAQDADTWALQRQTWVDHAGAAHTGLAQRLLDWWKNTRDANLRAHKLRLVADEVDALADFCESRDHLAILLPLFQSAALVARAAGEGQLADGPALRSLYAQLERCLHRSAQVVRPEDLLPADLLRNFLYYAAQIESESGPALALRRRFRLDRIRQVAQAGQSHLTPTIGVGYHLSRAIRHTLAAETDALRRWLQDELVENDSQRPRLIRLRVRLSQLEPVLSLMGDAGALRCLQSISQDLKQLDERPVLKNTSDDKPHGTGTVVRDIATRLRNPAVPPHDSEEKDSWIWRRSRLAKSLASLDSLLERNARNSISRSASAGSAADAADETVYVDMAIDACLREARASLQGVADGLMNALSQRSLSAKQVQDASAQLLQVERALQILPLPEVTPLLRGLVDVLTHLQRRGERKASLHDARSLREVCDEIANLLVSIDLYLASVLQPEASAGSLLVDAEDALLNACELLEEKPSASHSAVNVQEAERQVFRLLPFWDSLGESLSGYRADPSASWLAEIGQALRHFSDESTRGASASIERLATSASSWFEQAPALEPLLADKHLAMLDEIHALIPQLIDQWLSDSNGVRGLDDLLKQLEAASEPFELHDAGGLTLNVDEDLLSETLDDSIHSALDTTLEHVFHFECLGHLDDLDESVRSALQPRADLSLRLPTEQMLRALHTMAGSAQAVDATRITAIVQPLQRVALTRQREASSFDAAETRYIGELLGALRARLHSLATNDPVGADVEQIEARLPAFVAKLIPGMDARHSGLSLGSNVRSLNDVFAEEARELLDRLRQIVNKSPAPDMGSAALAVLHTLKGSARMAGRMSIAEHAHTLEQALQRDENDQASQASVLREGLKSLSGLIFQVSAQDSVAAAAESTSIHSVAGQRSDDVQVSDEDFEDLLDLATDVTVNQARLNDELGRLREVCQDIESTSIRWRKLPQAEQQQRNTYVMDEIMADMDAAQESMRNALHRAEREQQQSSRTAASLQQSLIRTRLVRVDEIRERLAQTVQDAAYAVEVHARVEISGGELTLDRALFRQLHAPLEHLVRNCIVHGIENETERVQSGKPAVGTISLVASIDGTDLVLDVCDDGRGIDKAEVNRVLAQRGEAPADTHEQLQAALFRSGFTRIATPTPVGGHGLGLPAVAASLEPLGARVQMASQLGEGTRISLRIPQRIVVNQVVLVEDEGALYAVLVNQVESVRTPGTPTEFPEHYRPVKLSRLLSRAAAAPSQAEVVDRSAVLVNLESHCLALEVDRVVGYRELVTQALGPQMASLHCYAGGSVLSDGRQVLILDLNRAMELPELQGPARLVHIPARPVALVIDDSLTMRVATEKLMQQCGIAVRLSRDGLQALESLASAMPNLIILDLEMPRLDGFGFLRQIRRIHGSKCPPVIVISSRDHETDHRLAESLGVVRFLSKPCGKAELQDAIQAAGLRLPDLTIA